MNFCMLSLSYFLMFYLAWQTRARQKIILSISVITKRRRNAFFHQRWFFVCQLHLMPVFEPKNFGFPPCCVSSQVLIFRFFIHHNSAQQFYELKNPMMNGYRPISLSYSRTHVPRVRGVCNYVTCYISKFSLKKR